MPAQQLRTLASKFPDFLQKGASREAAEESNPGASPRFSLQLAVRHAVTHASPLEVRAGSNREARVPEEVVVHAVCHAACCLDSLLVCHDRSCVRSPCAPCMSHSSSLLVLIETSFAMVHSLFFGVLFFRVFSPPPYAPCFPHLEPGLHPFAVLLLLLAGLCASTAPPCQSERMVKLPGRCVAGPPPAPHYLPQSV